MPTKITSIAFCVIFLPLMAPAQTPPPDVDQALRARVTEFLQYHVEGNFRKAFDLVAEDTKDNYFSSGKVQLTGFKIDAVKYSDNFTKAAVTATMSKTVSVGGQDLPVSLPSTTTWKIENGKWVWYNETKSGVATPMGLSPVIPLAAAPKTADIAPDALPKDFDDKAIAAAARSILQQVSVDKKEITLAADKPSEGTVIFHNGMTGSVQLELTVPDLPGFTAQVENRMVRSASDVPVVLRYQPRDPAERRDPINVMLTVQPVNQLFVIRVNFAASAPPAPQ